MVYRYGKDMQSVVGSVVTVTGSNRCILKI